MPFFVIICTEKEINPKKCLAISPQHIERMQKLDDEVRLDDVGAHPKDTNAPPAVFSGMPMIVED
ncbi:hypothetical protein JL991_10720 [Acinetobacter baumannii]|nr:hypothetical protein [Acinetobacter baumannii]